MLVLFLFFKQKTAYELRISDWSSDVCSSDLGCVRPPHARPRHAAGDGPQPRVHGARRGRDPRALDADQVQPVGGAVRADDRQQRRAAAGEGRMSAPVEETPAPAPASDARRKWIALYTVARREVVRFLRIWGQTLVPPAIARKSTL